MFGGAGWKTGAGGLEMIGGGGRIFANHGEKSPKFSTKFCQNILQFRERDFGLRRGMNREYGGGGIWHERNGIGKNCKSGAGFLLEAAAKQALSRRFAPSQLPKNMQSPHLFAFTFGQYAVSL